ncbi:MAG: type II secretion system ATPase GspE [Actinobacteria bacterium]|nr:type II secretion system ATPase GspE [Actinomycetota bacterium]
MDKIYSELVSEGFLTEEQLVAVRNKQEETGESLAHVLAEEKLLTEEQVAEFIGNQLGVPHIDLTGYGIDPEVIRLVPEGVARRYKIIPLFKIEDTLSIVMANPLDVFALDDIRYQVGCEVEPLISTESSIKTAIDHYYGASYKIDEVSQNIDEIAKEAMLSERINLDDLEAAASQPPVVKLVNEIILQAVRDKASDIHIEPKKEGLGIRYRIDGFLHRISSPPKQLLLPIVSRMKIMAGMDIMERRIPQDGRVETQVSGKDIDLRVSSYPTIYGEKLVLRVLDKSSMSFALPHLGLSDENLNKLQSIVKSPYGIILVVGPTGSGKSSTLYAVLSELNALDKNIITIEDPVEYQMENIIQAQVNYKVGMTFAAGLRSILRQDPDIIMVGEIRDKETAELAIRSSLTGHLVLSTLHTNDSAGAITRLIDMGIEPFLVASSILGILGQRLVRTICVKCKESYAPPEKALEELGVSKDSGLMLHKGKRCPVCKKTGFKGRTGIFELLLMNDQLRELTINKRPTAELKAAAIASGMKPLREDGFDKVKKGITTLEEVLRVVRLKE